MSKRRPLHNRDTAIDRRRYAGGPEDARRPCDDDRPALSLRKAGTSWNLWRPCNLLTYGQCSLVRVRWSLVVAMTIH